MPDQKKVAIVTGGNKGIGFGIVRGLCQKWDGDVYLTARDETRGKNAVSELNKIGLNPIYRRLDVTDEKSIIDFRDYIQQKYGKIDILINNAGIHHEYDEVSDIFKAERTLFVNYSCQVSVCNILFPLLKTGSRVVNVTSSDGRLKKIPSEKIRNKFSKDNLTAAELSQIVKGYIESVKAGTHIQEGWGKSSYVISKVAFNALTFIQDREYGPKGIYVNCCHPGYVDTDMTRHLGPLTLEQGAEAPLRLALSEAPYKGIYLWFDCRVTDWNEDV